MKTVHEVFLSSCARWADKVAVRIVSPGKSTEWTYDMLPTITYRLAQHLFELGLKRGDYITIACDNTSQWMLAAVAAFRLGAIVVPVPKFFDDEACISAITRTDSQVVIADTSRFARLFDRQNDHLAEHLLLIDDLLARCADETKGPSMHLPCVEKADPALLLFLSPQEDDQAILFDHRSLTANVAEIRKSLSITSKDRVVCTLPVSDPAALTMGILTPMTAGATVIQIRTRGAAHLREIMRHEDVTTLISNEAVLTSFLVDMEFELDEMPPSKRHLAGACKAALARGPLREISGALLKGVKEDLCGKAKLWVSVGSMPSRKLLMAFQSYGIHIQPAYTPDFASSAVALPVRTFFFEEPVLKLLPGVKATIDEPDGKGVGNVVVKGRGIATALWSDRETMQPLKDMWLDAGDLGSLDDGGRLRLADSAQAAYATASGAHALCRKIEQTLASGHLFKEVVAFPTAIEKIDELWIVGVLAEPPRDYAVLEEQIQSQLEALIEGLSEPTPGIRLQVWEKSLPKLPNGRVNRTEVGKIFKLNEALAFEAGSSIETDIGTTEESEYVLNALSDMMTTGLAKRVPLRHWSDLSPDTKLTGELGLDNLTRLTLAVKLNQELAVPLDEDIWQEVETVGDLIFLVKFWRHRNRVEMPPEDHQTDEFKGPHHLRVQSLEKAFLKSGPQKEDPKRNYKPLPDLPLGGRGKQNAVLDSTSRALFKTGLVTARTWLTATNQLKVTNGGQLKVAPPFILVTNELDLNRLLLLISCLKPETLERAVVTATRPDLLSQGLLSANSPAKELLDRLNILPLAEMGPTATELMHLQEILNEEKVLIFPTLPAGSQKPSRKDADNSLKEAALLSLSVNCPVIPCLVKSQKYPLFESTSITVGPALISPQGRITVKVCHNLTQSISEALAVLKGKGASDVSA